MACQVWNQSLQVTFCLLNWVSISLSQPWSTHNECSLEFFSKSFVMDCSWLQVQSGVWWHESCRLVDLQISDYPLEKINNQKYKFQGDTEDNHDIPRGIVWDEDFAPNIDEVDDDGSTSKLGGALIVALGATFLVFISLGAWLFSKRGDTLSGKPWKFADL